MVDQPKKSIFFFDIEDTVIDVGLRLAIAKEVPDELGIRIDNLETHRARVYLEGNETSCKKFYEKVKTLKLGKAKNYRFSEFKPLEGIGCFSINTERFYHKLQCEQLEKFVDSGLDMRKDIGGMRKDMSGMKKGMDKMVKAFEDFPNAILKAFKESK